VKRASKLSEQILLIIERPNNRWFGYDPLKEYEFVGFCDASELSYPAVLYMEINKR
jgi:Pao retrotransposon peptidase